MEGLGALCDLGDAGYYLFEGDWTGAGLSLGAAVPLAGEYLTVVRRAGRYTGDAAGLARAVDDVAAGGLADSYFPAAYRSGYTPEGRVHGQVTRSSCVAASCRMLLDPDPREKRGLLRAALETTSRGAYLSDVPDVLRANYGIETSYKAGLTLDQ